MQPSVSFAEITQDRVLLGLIDKANPEGRIRRKKWKAVESHLSLIALQHGGGLVPGQRQGDEQAR